MIGFGALDVGFHEATAVVLDVEATAGRLCGALGYRRLWSGKACAGALALLGLDPVDGAREALIGDPDQGRGFVRLFDLPARSSGVMRDGAQPWDTGGLFDIDIRALAPVEALHGAMTRAGFCAFAPITAFTFAGLAVRQVVEHDADGLAIALIERVSPPLVGFEQVRNPASYAFNASQVVPSLDAARALADALGWKRVSEASWTHADGRNCMGFPPDVARGRKVEVAIFQANGRMAGSVEFIAFDGEALDFSHAAPPDRGWAALRFPVSDVEAFLRRAAQGGCRTIGPLTMAMEPYGSTRAGVAVTPWGARLEAYRPI